MIVVVATAGLEKFFAGIGTPPAAAPRYGLEMLAPRTTRWRSDSKK
jgi:hypothetical protein